MSEEYSTRKGTRIVVPVDIPPGAEDVVIPAGTEGTVVEDTSTQAYRVVFDGGDGMTWTVGAYQVRKIWEPPTYAQLLAERDAALRIVAAVEAVLDTLPDGCVYASKRTFTAHYDAGYQTGKYGAKQIIKRAIADARKGGRDVSTRERFLSMFGGPIVHYLWIWRFFILFDEPHDKRFWRIESICLYDGSLEHPIRTLWPLRDALNAGRDALHDARDE